MSQHLVITLTDLHDTYVPRYFYRPSAHDPDYWSVKKPCSWFKNQVFVFIYYLRVDVFMSNKSKKDLWMQCRVVKEEIVEM